MERVRSYEFKKGGGRSINGQTRVPVGPLRPKTPMIPISEEHRHVEPHGKAPKIKKQQRTGKRKW